MREIKFRAYSKQDNRILEVIRIDFIEEILFLDTSILNDGRNQEIYDFDDIILMQYTGLKDKNGVEIYEGDILRIYDDFNAKVFYNLRFSSFEVATTGNSVGFYSKSGLEVIGNIYENPELLS